MSHLCWHRGGSGSGFFVDEALLPERFRAKGNISYHVLTNYHVIRPAVQLDIVLYDGVTCEYVRVIAEDEERDLALLLALHPKRVLTGIALADADPRVLTTVYAIGSPKGLGGSASEGTISGIRQFSGSDHLLQTTAPISPGSSGGPLLLADGTLAGVTTETLEGGQNINFAIPASGIRKFLTNTEFRPRDVEEGTSIRGHEREAFERLDSEVEFIRIKAGKSFSMSDDEKRAVAYMQQAYEEIPGLILPDEGRKTPISCYRKVLALAGATDDSLPPETKYLTHYVVGKAEYWMGFWISAKSKTIYTRDLEAVYRATENAQRAAYHLRETINLKPDFAPAYDALADHFRFSGNLADALLITDRLVTLMPRCADAWAKRAQCYVDLDQPEAARRDLETAIDLSPRRSSLHYELAELLAELGECQEALPSVPT